MSKKDEISTEETLRQEVSAEVPEETIEETIEETVEETVTEETESAVLLPPDLQSGSGSGITFWKVGVAAGIFLLLISAVAVFCILKKKKSRARLSEDLDTVLDESHMQTQEIGIGKLHNVGKRAGQQDCLGVINHSDGVCAVVADGMGGLSDGDKVSQKVVMTVLQEVAQNKKLVQAVAKANQEVNRMLGQTEQYKSGTTVVAVLVNQNQFEWISVGDSRIYLYRHGKMIQLNREHTYEAELIQMAVNGEIPMGDVQKDPQRNKLTSFIGMGHLKHVDMSLRAISLQPKDRILLMSDGVFNTLSEEEMTEILKQYENPKDAAAAMEERIINYQRPKQDNFTAVILQL